MNIEKMKSNRTEPTEFSFGIKLVTPSTPHPKLQGAKERVHIVGVTHSCLQILSKLRSHSSSSKRPDILASSTSRDLCHVEPIIKNERSTFKVGRNLLRSRKLHSTLEILLRQNEIMEGDEGTSSVSIFEEENSTNISVESELLSDNQHAKQVLIWPMENCTLEFGNSSVAAEYNITCLNHAPVLTSTVSGLEIC
eukprot:TCALIF_07654-PA protein Name:"Protein of unknown function" AED:0.37 eAED:0.58 QI:0/0/0/0.66/0/0.33/3/0/194